MIPLRRHRVALGLGALVLLAAGAGLLLLRQDDEGWTAATPEARAELQAGERALARFYRQEAVERFERALELDPDNVMARLYLVLNHRQLPGGADRAAQLLEELRAVDPETLTPRERLLLGYYLARIDHEPEKAVALLEAYLADHPHDPYAVELRCGDLWARADWDAAEECYQELTRLDPNRVEAQNRVGYIRMARGEFADAEAQFQIYEFLAPDQANPHDSMGELLLITGRYAEARRELRRALELRPDFCASWTNLVLLELVRGEPEAAAEVLAEAERAQGCPPAVLDVEECRVELWRQAAAGAWEGAWRSALACGGDVSTPVDLHVAALAAAGAGRLADLRALEEEVAAEYGPDGDPSRLEGSPSLRMLAAARAWAEGRPGDAAEHARAADERLFYWSGQWPSKLLARRLAAAALRADGRPEEAAELEQQVEDVHPGMISDPPFPLPPPGAAGRATATP